MGILSLYFASTSWFTVKRKEKQIGLFDYCAFISILAVAITFYKWGWDFAYG